MDNCKLDKDARDVKELEQQALYALRLNVISDLILESEDNRTEDGRMLGIMGREVKTIAEEVEEFTKGQLFNALVESYLDLSDYEASKAK